MDYESHLNPLMMGLLQSPFHGWISRSLLVLTVRGRKSGKEYSLVMNYFLVGKTVILIPAMVAQFARERHGTHGLRGVAMQGQAEMIEGSAGHPDAMGMLTAFLGTNPSLAGILGL